MLPDPVILVMPVEDCLRVHAVPFAVLLNTLVVCVRACGWVCVQLEAAEARIAELEAELEALRASSL